MRGEPQSWAGISADAAARRMVASRLRDLVRSVRTLEDTPADTGTPDSAVHALRVASRRAAVTLNAFAAVMPRRTTRPLRRAVRDLRRGAGALRDCDVHGALFTELIGHAGSLGAEHAMQLLRQDRLVAEAHLKEAVRRRSSARLRSGVQRLKASLRAGGDESVEALGASRIRELAMAARGHAARDLALPANLHALRIAMKRLRYAAELFAPALGDAFAQELLPRLEEAQRVLGDVNDISSLVDRLDRYLRSVGTSHPSELPDAAGDLRRSLGVLQKRFAAVRDLRFARAAAWWHSSGVGHVLETLAPGDVPPVPSENPPPRDHPALPVAPVPMECVPMPDTVAAYMNGRTASPQDPQAGHGPERQRDLWLSGRRPAVIDIGSNSIRLLAVELFDSRSWKTLAEERAMTRLAQGLTRTGELSAEAMARSVEAISRFKSIAERLGATVIRAFATAAVREAGNRADFLSLVHDRTGITVELVSARDEGTLTHRSVARVFDLSHARAVVVDIGGGSLEVVSSRNGVITGNTSLPLGAVRVTEAFGGADACAGPKFKAMRRYAADRIERRVRADEVPPELLIGCGGTFTTLLTLAAAARGVLLDRNSPALSTLGPVSRAQLRAIIDELSALSLEARLRVPGLPSDRADIVLAGFVVIERLMKHLGCAQLHVHPGGFREGLLLRMIDEQALDERNPPAAAAADPMDAVRAFAQRCGYERAHSEHVAKLSLRLYDQLREGSDLIRGLGSDRRERLILHAAAVLHDVGVMVEYRAHHKHTQTIVRHSGLPGFTEREIELIAQVCRYHRRASPRYKHRAFAALPEPDRDLVRRLAGLLRVADGLDRTHSQGVQNVHVRFGTEEVRFEVESSDDPTTNLAASLDKSDLLGDLIGLGIQILPSPPQAG